MNQMAILMYHSLDSSGSVVSTAPRDFADQMTCLIEEGFHAMSLREAVAHRQLRGVWPERSVALTFDDGFANVHEHALPILMRLAFTATVFVISGHIGGENDWAMPPPKLGTQKMLSWRQASELAAAGIEIGSHTRTHPDLRRCGMEKALQEMIESRSEIEHHLGRTVNSFAYPYGRSNRRVRCLAAKEFGAVCTTKLSRANNDSLDSLPRIDMYYLNSLPNLRRLIHGQLDGYLQLRRWGRFGRRLVVSDS